MNHLICGNVYDVVKHRSGTSKNGAWELFTILDEKKRNEITVFANNLPNKGHDGCKIKIVSITEVKNGVKKGSDEKWYQTVSINANVEVIESDLNPDGTSNPFEDGTDFADSIAPWD